MAINAAADIDDFTHHLMAHDIAGKHRGNKVMKEMQVGTADRAARDLYDGIALILDLGVGHPIAADIFFAVPNQCFHEKSSRNCFVMNRSLPSSFLTFFHSTSACLSARLACLA